MLSYYGQAIGGHLSIMAAARPVDEWLQNPDTPAPLKQRLERAEQIRSFAVTALDLPDNASYHRYADLHRAAAVWNVAAAPVDSLALKQWCFWFVGCVGYRGYYKQGAAEAEGAKLRADDKLEVTVYGVPAYSTLGWLNWLGGDPLLSTFIHAPEGELARLIFHELAHQKIYVDGDTTFNESYADAVSYLGVEEWLAQRAGARVREDYALVDARRRAFRHLTRQTRAELDAIYQQKPAVGLTRVLALKADAMVQFRAHYAALKARWSAEGHPFDGYDAWVAKANNASFGVLAAYDEFVPAFEALFRREDRDWPRFYAAVRKLGDLPKAERRAQLKALMDGREQPAA
ncbi:MAG: aminopeptidase [Burkholderiaceae bacterium]|nr:MAG: aminopeptidase [Burkholderiaceae bacterium]